VTAIGLSHVGSQALCEVGHQPVDVFLWKLFQTVCKVTFNSSVVLVFDWSYDAFPEWCFRRGSAVGSILERLKVFVFDHLVTVLVL